MKKETRQPRRSFSVSHEDRGQLNSGFELTSFEEVPDLLGKLVLSGIRPLKLGDERSEDVRGSSRESSFALNEPKPNEVSSLLLFLVLAFSRS